MWIKSLFLPICVHCILFICWYIWNMTLCSTDAEAKSFAMLWPIAVRVLLLIAKCIRLVFVKDVCLEMASVALWEKVCKVCRMCANSRLGHSLCGDFSQFPSSQSSTALKVLQVISIAMETSLLIAPELRGEKLLKAFDRISGPPSLTGAN